MPLSLALRMLSGAATLALLVNLAACASRPGPDVLATVAAPVPEGAKMFHVYAATSRARAAEGRNEFTAERSERSNYARFDISVPPGHKAGEIEWPNGKPDPRTSFAVLDQQTLDEQAFFRAISAAPAQREVGVFVHGYNVNYQEALYRFGQMAADANIDGVPVLFAWPSQATLSGYLADKEAVTYSRDNLAAMLAQLVKRRASGDTLVFAHSMGCWLSMEALRQLKLQGRDDVLLRLKVFLAAPDIDVNVFQAQLAVIGRMRTPITIFVSKDDLVLNTSGLLAGDHRRVGALDVADPRVAEAARRNGVLIIDVSEVASSDSLGHGRYAALAMGLPALEREGRLRAPTLSEAGAFFFDTTGAAISSPFRLGSKVFTTP